MNKQDKKIASENMSMNFGVRGWWVIIYQALMFFFLIGFSIDGLNIVPRPSPRPPASTTPVC